MKRKGYFLRPLAMGSLAVALVSIFGVALSGLGVRAGVWSLGSGFTLLRWTAFLGFIAVLFGFFIAVAATAEGARRALGLAVLSVVIGGVAAGVPFRWQQAAQSLPPLHDITTDTVDPPRFVKAKELREGAENPVEYGGELVALIQKRSYPEIKPLPVERPPREAFGLALEAVRKMGLEVTAAAPDEGRIEAVDTTFWFGFKDDVVVRVTATEGGSLIDVRSLSRIGTGDVGTNARRIRKFLDLVEEAAAGK